MARASLAAGSDAEHALHHHALHHGDDGASMRRRPHHRSDDTRTLGDMFLMLNPNARRMIRRASIRRRTLIPSTELPGGMVYPSGAPAGDDSGGHGVGLSPRAPRRTSIMQSLGLSMTGGSLRTSMRAAPSPHTPPVIAPMRV